MAVSIRSATLGSTGEVRRGRVVSDAEAIVERQEGRDVVVCGDNLAINRSTAERIETSANGASKRCPPHINVDRMLCRTTSRSHDLPPVTRFTRLTNAKRNERGYEVFHSRTLRAVQFGSCVGG